MSKYSRYMELRTPNPLAPNGEEEIWKCSRCNAETFDDKGWSGSPNTHVCSHDCQMDHGDLKVGNSRTFAANIRKVDFSKPWTWAGKEPVIEQKGTKTVYRW